MLYKAGGRVYIAGRSKNNADDAITAIKASASSISAVGQLEFLYLDLQYLSTIKPAAEQFQSQERKLDVLWNNADVSLPPLGSVSKQGRELQLATNCLGPFLLTQLLLPSLRVAAQDKSFGQARVVWTSSLVVETSAPEGGIKLEDLVTPPKDKKKNYVFSKTGNWFLASEMARDVASSSIISVTQNPGSLKTNLLRNAPWLLRFLSYPLLYNAKMGAYTELWAGLSPEVNDKNNRSYIISWGRFHQSLRKDVLDAMKPKSEGGTGQAKDFREWCETQVADYS
ncbi:hypothetical protein MMC14_006227 [Varicellaria rhodocarpa]|nr:hypothetical protein [Varicellaria rhodocarpa]